MLVSACRVDALVASPNEPLSNRFGALPVRIGRIQALLSLGADPAPREPDATPRHIFRFAIPAFAYYQDRWTAQEIADYATRILLRETTGRSRSNERGPHEDAHAWQEPAPYLPVPRTQTRMALEHIETMLKRVGVLTDDRDAVDL